MPRYTTVHYKLRTLFPPNDEYATTIARLCILWEDFITEATGGSEENFPKMDGISSQARRLYFLRKTIGTLHEIISAVEHLSTIKEFKNILNRRVKTDKKVFREDLVALRKHYKKIKSLRDDFAGGHVLQRAVQVGLNKLDENAVGMLQQGVYYKDTRFKFVHLLGMNMMFPIAAGHNPKEEMEKFTKFMHEVIRPAFRLIHLSFSLYVHQRKIFHM